MTYSTSVTQAPATGILSGTLASNAGEPLSGVIVSGYADSAANAASYFVQTRANGQGAWSLSAANLPPGTHTVVVTADYGAPVGTLAGVAGAPALPNNGSTRIDLLVNNNIRA